MSCCHCVTLPSPVVDCKFRNFTWKQSALCFHVKLLHYFGIFLFSRSKHRPLVVLPIAQRAVKKCCKNLPRKVLICCWRLHKIQNIWRIWQDYLHYYQKTSSMMLLNVFQIVVKMIKICCGTYYKKTLLKSCYYCSCYYIQKVII